MRWTTYWTTYGPPGPRCGYTIGSGTRVRVFTETDVFHLPIAELTVGGGPLANYRDHMDPDLDALAQSIRDLGQLQPVLVAETPEGWVLAAGFRRVTALLSLGAPTVQAKRVPADKIDLVRLAENFDRANPTSFETCRYLHELHTGSRGTRRTFGEIAQAVGRSARYVGNLVRFFREAPPALRDAWRDDRDSLFTFSRLSDLVMRAKRGENFEGALASVLGKKPAAVAAGPAGSPPPKPAKGTKAPVRRLGRTGADRLARMLAQAGEDRLKTDERAVIVLELLGAVAGHVPANQVKARVESILADLGFDPSKAPEAGGGHQYDIEKGWS